jgi:peptidyl-prolyl cis-trans isomerase B (cyclophilin B)
VRRRRWPLRSLRRCLPLGALLVLAACGGGSKHAACSPVDPPAPRDRTAPKPKAPLDPRKTYDVTLKTNCGSFTIRLAVKTSPATSASFASLARRGYFDGTLFHRIVPGFVIQGGDPSASGFGGPGYTTVDKPPTTTRYTKGIVAMAKGAADPAGAGGSQFFVVTGEDARLPPDYAVLGHVENGLDVVERIGRLGDPATEKPTQAVEIEHATVAKR